MEEVDYAIIDSIDPKMLRAAIDFCANTENVEYVRGQAELIIDMTPGLNMDNKERLMHLLTNPTPAPPETLMTLGDGIVWVVRCVEPTDANYGGWDVLVKDYEGVWACVGETHDDDTARLMAGTAYNVTFYR